MAGTGAGYFAVREAVAEARRQRAQWDDLRARRAELRGNPGERAARAGFPCDFLCLDCGRLTPAAPDACGACGSEMLADLGDEAVFITVREWDRRARDKVGLPLRFLGAGTFGGAAGGATYALAPLLGLGVSLTGVLAVAAVGAAAGFAVFNAVPSAAAGLRRAAPAPPPLRWSLPTPEQLSSAPGHGALRLRDAPLTAPFSRRACAGWRVQVFFDVPGDAVPERCVLDAARMAAVAVGEVEYAADTLLIEETGPATEHRPAYSEAERFLRARGFDASEGSFRVVERVLPVDGAAVVKDGTIETPGSSAPVAIPARLASGEGVG